MFVREGKDAEDADVLLKQKVDGKELFRLTEAKVLAPPYSMLGGPASALSQAIEELKLLKKLKPYTLVPPDEALRSKLHDPDNCLVYRLGANKEAPINIHVGVKRVMQVIDPFKSANTSGQAKRLLFVVGPPKSGKTSETMVIAPHLLAPHIKATVSPPVGGQFQEPCRRVYIDCTRMRNLKTLQSKLYALYRASCVALGVAPAREYRTAHFLELADYLRIVFCTPVHYHIVSLDEYHMLFANLKANDRQNLANFLRAILLDPESPCQFVVTGSTGAALISALSLSLPNGVWLFKGAGVINTEMQSSPKELEDVATLLKHYFPGVPDLTPAHHKVISDSLGYLNCAALNIIMQDMRNGNKTLEEATHAYLDRVRDIYQRDYEATLRESPAVFEKVLHYVNGTTEPPETEWMPLLEKIPLSDGTKLWVWREPLFVAFTALPRGKYNEPLYFEIQLFRILGRLTEHRVKDEAAFNHFFEAHLKDRSVLPELYRFLAERRVSYFQKKARDNSAYEAKAKRSAEDWLNSGEEWIDQVRNPSTKTPRPLRFFREMRNSTFAHDETRDGKPVRHGYQLFVKYLGQNDREKALQFLLDAQQYFN
jgi:hypothetical protein